MKCLFVDGKCKVSIQDREIPEVGENDALIKIESRGICGTDLNSYRTGVAMGFGHEMGGYVYKKGKNVNIKEGTKVFVNNLNAMSLVSYAPDPYFSYMGGFADYILVKDAVENINLFTVPDNMSYSQTALIEPFCVSMSGVKKIKAKENAKIVILGAGIIGMGCYQYLKNTGHKDVVIVDINENRLEKVKEAGAIPFNSQKGNFQDFLKETFGESFSATAGIVPDVDAYIDCAGVESLLNQCLDIAKAYSQIIILAAYKKLVSIQLGAVMNNIISIDGSCMFTNDDILEAIDLISNHSSISKEMITHEVPFENASQAFEIANDANISLKVMMVG